MSDVLDRLRTDAEAPMRVDRPHRAVIEPFHANSWLVNVGPTAANYVSLKRYTGTQSDPGGRLVLPERSHARAVHQIRLISGLTWQELSKLFGVSRRSIHNWANGEPLKTDHAQFVIDALRAIMILRRPSAAETRLVLLTYLPSGTRPLDLLAAKKWADAMAAAVALPSLQVPAGAHPDPLQRHPTTYFGAMTDRPVPSGHSIPGRSRRVRRRSS